MPDPITLGHLMLALGVAALVAAGWFLLAASRYHGPEHGRGTPGYARARLDRRKALYAGIVGALLLAACLTPLCHVPLTGAAA